MRREVVVAALIAVALVGVAAAEYESKKPAFYKAPAYVASPKESNPDIQVQGGIYCKDYGKLSPLEGAMARLTCIARGKEGYESYPFSVVSKGTDSKGYFKINLSKYDVGPYKLTACKVFLETPPPGECSVRTDINHGVSGASLPPTYRVLSDQTRLYSILPLVYTKPAY